MSDLRTALLPAAETYLDSSHKNNYFARMPKINLNIPTKTSQQDAFNSVKSLFETDADLKKMDPSYVCDFNDSDCSGTAKGSKFSASMKIMAQGEGSEIDVTIEIPFMLSPFKGMIKETLQKKLSKTLS